MAAAITTTSTISAPINYALMGAFLARANQACVYPAITQAGRLSSHSGSFTVKWRRYEQETPTTSALSQLTGNVAFPTRTSSAPSITDVTAAVSKYGDYYLLNEEVDIVNPQGQDLELAEVLGQQAGRSLNRLARDEVEDNATQRLVGGVAGAGSIVSAITRNAVDGTVKVLHQNSAMKYFSRTNGSQNTGTSPIQEAFMAICHVDVRPDVERLTGFHGVETYSGQTETMAGEFGYCGLTRFLATEEASSTADSGGANAALVSTTGTNIDLYETIFAGRNAVGSVGLDENHPDAPYYADDKQPTIEVIVHNKGSAGVADALNELASIGWKFWAKFKITNGNWVRRLTTGATAYA